MAVEGWGPARTSSGLPECQKHPPLFYELLKICSCRHAALGWGLGEVMVSLHSLREQNHHPLQWHRDSPFHVTAEVVEGEGYFFLQSQAKLAAVPYAPILLPSICTTVHPDHLIIWACQYHQNYWIGAIVVVKSRALSTWLDYDMLSIQCPNPMWKIPPLFKSFCNGQPFLFWCRKALVHQRLPCKPAKIIKMFPSFLLKKRHPRGSAWEFFSWHSPID